MRVPFSAAPNNLIYQLNHLTARQSQLQSEAATGQRLTMPEDDPAAMQRVLTLQVEASATGQNTNNIGLLKEQATASLSAMRAVMKVSDRIGEISTQADDMKSKEELRFYAVEVEQLIRQSVQAMNIKFRDEYLFSGTQTDAPPFKIVEDGAGQITGVTFQGNTTIPDVRISESEAIGIKVPGANATGSGARGVLVDTRVGADFFGHLVALHQNLLSGNTADIAATDRPALAVDEQNLVLHLGENAAMQSRLNAAEGLASSRKSSLKTLISREADADLAQTMVQLNATQNAYRAALQSGAMLFQTSLMDFLR